MQKELIIKIQKELKKIKTRYQMKYGAVIFDVKVKSVGDSVVLDGVVLSEKQKNEVFFAVKDIVKNSKVGGKIKILSNFEENLEIGWGIIVADIVDIWAKFPDKQKPIGLSSQAIKSDFVRILAKKSSWILAQTRDLAIGWVASSQVKISDRETVKKEWIKIKRAKSGKTIKKRLVKNIQDKFLDFLKKYLNMPYLLGGMTEKGIDCSGLIENFYSDIFGIMLPRHSGDQAMCGEKFELNAAHFGDLVYMRHKATKFAHIGVVVEKFETRKNKRLNFNDVLILNARKEKGLAIIEDLPEILKSYNLISVKRIIE